ncbi:MAG TPA: VOC family protein [Cyclobacteriaceae bacterium]|nr:VOC family protein [Cyclobacteriaceae bacterium]
MGTSKTYGLTHFAIKVKNVARTLEFYQKIFDVTVMYQSPGWVQVQTPGSHDILVFEESRSRLVGQSGGIVHFGFRLKRPDDIDEMLARVKSAGAKIKEQGEFVPGSPYVFFYDPDGYEIEIWFEAEA